MPGAGLLRRDSFDTVDVPTIGEEIRDGGPAAEALALFLCQVQYQHCRLDQNSTVCVPFPRYSTRCSASASSFS